MSDRQATTHVAFDIGGTFADVTFRTPTGLRSTKLLAVEGTIGAAIAELLDGSLRDGEQQVDRFVHGTTIGSNAIIEGKTARTALITSAGFRDVLEMRGQRGSKGFAPRWDPPAALVPRHLRFEVPGRIAASGFVEVALDLKVLPLIVDQLLEADVAAVALCLINAHMNPDHEAMVLEQLVERAPWLVCCASHQLQPEIREYERTSTTVVNAALMPVVRSYITGLKADLDRFSTKLLVMQSSGGLMSAESAMERPAYTTESGPAAGVLAASRLAREARLPNVLSFDMGGTTAKACLVEEGRPLEKPGGEVGVGATVAASFSGGGSSGAGHALRVPSLDIVEVGAGGGSVAWIDRGGALRVGPESAGASPGPVCYGLGGTRPTVTDANVVLGYMNPRAIADASVSIDSVAAAEAIDRDIARPLGLSTEAAAHGIVTVANATMTRALRAVSTERGRDPRGFTLVGFGGAGPLHAVGLAESMGIRTVVVPDHAGVFSAVGLLLADFRTDRVHALHGPLSDCDETVLLKTFRQMEDDAVGELARQGAVPSDVTATRSVDLRYKFQVAEMNVPFPVGEVTEDGALIAALGSAIDAAHLREYGYVPVADVEVVAARVQVVAAATEGRWPSDDLAAMAPEERTSRSAYFGVAHGLVETEVITGEGLSGRRSGPVIIERPDTTIVVPPAWSVERSASVGAFVLTKTP